MAGLHGRKKYVGIALESTKGQAATISSHNIVAFDPSINQSTNFTTRTPTGMGPGQIEAVPEERMGTASIQVEVRNDGDISKLFQAGGMDDTLALVSSLTDQQTATVEIYEDGLLKKLRGAMCNVTIEGEFGKRILATFEFTGIWVQPTDLGSAPSITRPSKKPLRVTSATFNVASNAKKISNFSIDFGNDIQMTPDVADDSGLAHAFLADRAPTISFDPEASLVANDDVFGDWIGRVIKSLSIQAGSSGNQFTFDAPRLQYIDPQETIRQGLQAHEIQSNLNAEAGDDEFTMSLD